MLKVCSARAQLLFTLSVVIASFPVTLALQGLLYPGAASRRHTVVPGPPGNDRRHVRRGHVGRDQRSRRHRGTGRQRLHRRSRWLGPGLRRPRRRRHRRWRRKGLASRRCRARRPARWRRPRTRPTAATAVTACRSASAKRRCEPPCLVNQRYVEHAGRGTPGEHASKAQQSTPTCFAEADFMLTADDGWWPPTTRRWVEAAATSGGRRCRTSDDAGWPVGTGWPPSRTSCASR